MVDFAAQGWRPGDVVTINGMICVLEYVREPGDIMPKLVAKPRHDPKLTRRQRRAREAMQRKAARHAVR